MKHVLVTGVSSGIGQAIAMDLLSSGYSVLGSVRKAIDAERFSDEFASQFTPLIMDVTNEDQIQSAAAQAAEVVGEEGLWGLVNNSGISQPGPLSEIPVSMMRDHLEVNVMGVFNVTRACLPLLRQGKLPGRIINMSSTAGRIAFPFMGPYASSKHALEAMSDSWRRELMLYGVDLIVIQPGPIRTPIWDKAAETYRVNSYSAYSRVIENVDLEQYKRHALPPERVVRVVRRALESRSPKSRYVLPGMWLSHWLVPRLVPDRWLDWMIKKSMGLDRHNAPDSEQNAS